MSVKVMSAVFERYPRGGGEMLLALALADVARDDGRLMVHDRVQDLAQKTRQTDRGVQLQLQRMMRDGWLELVETGGGNGGRGRPAVYRISADWINGGELAGESQAHPEPEKGERGSPSTVNVEAEKGERGSPSTVNVEAEKGERGSPSYKEPNTDQIPITPQPPLEGGEGPVADAIGKQRKAEQLTLKAWLERCRERGEQPIPADDPVFAYAERVGIGRDVLELHWAEFKARRSEGLKRQADWRKTFRNSVRDNWYRLWYIAPGQAAQLTTTGRQAQAARAP